MNNLNSFNKELFMNNGVNIKNNKVKSPNVIYKE